MTETWEPVPGLILTGIHPSTECAGRHCIIHNPVRNHVTEWPIHWRADRGLYFERICPHGVGHPDPSQFDYWDLTGRSYEKVHGCDLHNGVPCCGYQQP